MTSFSLSFMREHSREKKPVLMVKNLPAMRETWVRSLGWENPLEEGMATHSINLACLENPMDKVAWQATVHRVAQSETRLK